MKMSEAPLGQLVFTETLFNEYDEVRETYYTPLDNGRYLHHGCAQGAKTLEASERPRYVNYHPAGFEYPMVRALPVKPIRESRFISFVAAAVPVPDTLALYAAGAWENPDAAA